MSSTAFNWWTPDAERTLTVAGAAADTPFAVSGILTTDKLLSVDKYTAGVFAADLTSEATISSDGYVNCDTTNTNGGTDTVVVRYLRIRKVPG